MVTSQRSVDWQPLRDAFVQRAPRPTYAELATEFKVPAGTIGVCASEEAWPSLREAYLDEKLRKCDAQSVLLEAVQVDRTFIRKFSNLGIVTLDKLTSTIESIDDARAPQTKAQAINTCMFAAANLAKALHEVGIVGVSRTLDGAGKEDNGRWNPSMLQQINLTVQNLTAKAEAVVDAAKASVPAPVMPAEHQPSVEPPKPAE